MLASEGRKSAKLVFRRPGALARRLLAAFVYALLTWSAVTAASAKTPGARYCYGGACHRVSTLEEMDGMVGRRGMLLASYYDHCRRDRHNTCGLTSSGSVFRADRADNAASPIYPDGTVILAYNPASLDAAVLRVTSAGPYRGSRKLDVSRAAAERLGFIKSGVAELFVSVLMSPTAEDARYRLRREYQSVPGHIGRFSSFDDAVEEASRQLKLTVNTQAIQVASGPSFSQAWLPAPPVVPKNDPQEPVDPPADPDAAPAPAVPEVVPPPPAAPKVQDVAPAAPPKPVVPAPDETKQAAPSPAPTAPHVPVPPVLAPPVVVPPVAAPPPPAAAPKLQDAAPVTPPAPPVVVEPVLRQPPKRADIARDRSALDHWLPRALAESLKDERSGTFALDDRGPTGVSMATTVSEEPLDSAPASSARLSVPEFETEVRPPVISSEPHTAEVRIEVEPESDARYSMPPVVITARDGGFYGWFLTFIEEAKIAAKLDPHIRLEEEQAIRRGRRSDDRDATWADWLEDFIRRAQYRARLG